MTRARSVPITDIRKASEHLQQRGPLHLSRALGRVRFTSLVSDARLMHAILDAALTSGRPVTMGDIVAVAPVNLASNGCDTRPGLDLLLARGAVQVHTPGYGGTYEITEAGRELHARLDRWAQLEQLSVLDVLELL